MQVEGSNVKRARFLGARRMRKGRKKEIQISSLGRQRTDETV